LTEVKVGPARDLPRGENPVVRGNGRGVTVEKEVGNRKRKSVTRADNRQNGRETGRRRWWNESGLRKQTWESRMQKLEKSVTVFQ
jgi:hypothetical protein